jgi:hypothetical protein
MLCTGCEQHWYGPESGPCPNCFPGLDRGSKTAALAVMEEVIDDFFAFQAAACTAQPDCTCGRGPEHHQRP